MKLKENIKKSLYTPVNTGRLMTAMNKHFTTIKRWIDTDSEKLTTKRAVAAISQITGFPESELFEAEKETAGAY